MHLTPTREQVCAHETLNMLANLPTVSPLSNTSATTRWKQTEGLFHLFVRFVTVNLKVFTMRIWEKPQVCKSKNCLPHHGSCPLPQMFSMVCSGTRTPSTGIWERVDLLVVFSLLWHGQFLPCVSRPMFAIMCPFAGQWPACCVPCRCVLPASRLCFLFMCLPSHVLTVLFFTCSTSPESGIKNEKLKHEVILEVFSCQK